MPAYLVVRAVWPKRTVATSTPGIAPNTCPTRRRHLSTTAWRAWSRTDPSVHYAYYQFADVAAAEAIARSPAIQALVAEFDARWGSA